MTNLIQWDPFAELRESMDRLFEQGFSRPWRYLASSDYAVGFPMEVWETPDAIEVKAALPGINPDDVNVSVVNDVLTIKAEHRAEEAQGQRNYYRREIPYGSFTRSFTLPVAVDADKAEATSEYGMLHLVLPKAESVRPKQIRIVTHSNGAKQLTS